MTDDTTRRELIVKVWDAAWDRGEVDAFDTILDPHYQRHGTHGSAQDRETFKASILSTRAAFPDLKTTIDDIVLEGDRAAIRWHSAGSHTGAFMGIPTTGKRVQVSGATFARFDGDGIVEEFVTWDPRALLSALGIITVGQD
ncbi:ester cyclase [Rhodococcus sp. T2V]|uniref:ester cyclase n=1 Tax=unclassified Rhodococcus (in: high G+C Gram-positive bacteria) TaxID=192944 RepID=UPI0023E10B14|nr:ester cyclase [Rhodococcus sp. T2V]MDF3307022.1 ester cyclase [Rhodococcus sp. T2V]